MAVFPSPEKGEERGRMKKVLLSKMNEAISLFGLEVVTYTNGAWSIGLSDPVVMKMAFSHHGSDAVGAVIDRLVNVRFDNVAIAKRAIVIALKWAMLYSPKKEEIAMAIAKLAD